MFSDKLFHNWSKSDHIMMFSSIAKQRANEMEIVLKYFINFKSNINRQNANDKLLLLESIIQRIDFKHIVLGIYS